MNLKLLLRSLFPRLRSLITLLVFLVLGFAILVEVVVYQVGLIPSRFYSVLIGKDHSGFTWTVVESLVLVVAVALLKASLQYLGNMLYVSWRRSVTQYAHSMYFSSMNFYHMNVSDRSIDNPDQRMTADVEQFCKRLKQILPVVTLFPFITAYYMYQCALITGYLGPVSVLAFFLIAALSNRLLITPVANYVFKQEAQEGDFRHKHVSVRDSAESIAFYRGGTREYAKTTERLERLLKTQDALYARHYLLDLSVHCCDYLGSILSYLVLAIPILSGGFDKLTPQALGALISKNAFVMIYLINCFTRLIDLAPNLTVVIGCGNRITGFIELMEKKGKTSDNSNEACSTGAVLQTQANTSVSREPLLYQTVDTATVNSLQPRNTCMELNRSSEFVSLTDVTVMIPDGSKALVRGLNMKLRESENLLITGDSGVGKSSLLRVIAGLWRPTCGSVYHRLPLGHDGIFFLPQKPYFTNGSLLEQVLFFTGRELVNVTVNSAITYPLKPVPNSDSTDILERLDEFDLNNLLQLCPTLDTPVDFTWSSILSPGEMQRLSFVRLFYHQPPVAVMDEATSQLPVSMETRLYSRCTELGISLVSVGHRDTLRGFHHSELRLCHLADSNQGVVTDTTTTGTSSDAVSSWILKPIHVDA